MNRFGDMDDFIARLETKRRDAERRAAKLPQDYKSIDEWHEDHIRSEPSQDQANRRP